MNLERDEIRRKGKARINKFTASLTTFIIDSLQGSTAKLRICCRSKQWWIDALKIKLTESRKAKRQAKKYSNTETQVKAKKCGGNFFNAISKVKHKCCNDFLSYGNSNHAQLLLN